MVKVTIRARNQLTVPVDIAAAAGLATGSLCDMDYANGVITITPSTSPALRPLGDFAGIARGVWGDTDEAMQRQIRDDRESWQR